MSESVSIGSRVKNLTGVIFGKLTVIEVAGKIDHRVVWKCKCECGNVVEVRSSALVQGKKTHCGCSSDVIRSEAATVHGQSVNKTPTYRSWVAMRQRCNDKNCCHYPDYGERGITVCERWNSFENFLVDMGPRPDGTTLDRFPDVNGNYEPGNCRWATSRQQSRNRRNSLYLTIDGEKKMMIDWAVQYGINHVTVFGRLKRGWSHEDAIKKPVNTNCHTRKVRRDG